MTRCPSNGTWPNCSAQRYQTAARLAAKAHACASASDTAPLVPLTTGGGAGVEFRQVRRRNLRHPIGRPQRRTGGGHLRDGRGGRHRRTRSRRRPGSRDCSRCCPGGWRGRRRGTAAGRQRDERERRHNPTRKPAYTHHPCPSIVRSMRDCRRRSLPADTPPPLVSRPGSRVSITRQPRGRGRASKPSPSRHRRRTRDPDQTRRRPSRPCRDRRDPAAPSRRYHPRDERRTTPSARARWSSSTQPAPAAAPANDGQGFAQRSTTRRSPTTSTTPPLRVTPPRPPATPSPSGYTRVVSCGGDGTLNEVVNGFFTRGRRRSRSTRMPSSACCPAAPGATSVAPPGFPTDPAAARCHP